MVFNYKRKSERQKWSTEIMQQAVNSVISGEMGYYKASVSFGVPQTTLERYVKKRKNNPNDLVSKILGSKRAVFNATQEEELATYLKEMEARLFGLTMTECRILAFQLADLNGLDHPFNKINKMAGKGWMQGFLGRHKELSIRKPEATSGARAMGFNRVAVLQFFKLLEETVEEYQLTADRIYNVDETGVTVNPKGASRIIALKGKRQVGALTSGERGETITAEICFSASGAYMPPMLIFPRKRMQQGFLDGPVPGGWIELNDKGWIDMTLFFSWFKKFVQYSKSSKDYPVLLLLDGHSSHTKNLDVINYARDNGVILLCFPPHCTHRLQALDVSFMKPLSSYYDDEVRKWLRTNPGRVVTFLQITSLFSAAYLRAATMLTAINGFRKIGVWPVDRNIFSDADFLPSATTNLVNIESSTLSNTEAQQDEPHSVHHDEKEKTPEPQPGTSKDSNATFRFISPSRQKTPEPQPGTSRDSDTSFRFISPQAILSIPQVQPTKKRVSRKRGKTAILTSSPYKNEYLSIYQSKVKTIKRKVDDVKKKSKQTKTSKTNKVELDTDSDVSDTDCLYCGDFWSTSSEGWICCSGCHKWAHNSCAGTEDDDDEAVFFCEHCL